MDKMPLDYIRACRSGSDKSVRRVWSGFMREVSERYARLREAGVEPFLEIGPVEISESRLVDEKYVCTVTIQYRFRTRSAESETPELR